MCLEVKKTLPFQVDGEAGLQPPGIVTMTCLPEKVRTNNKWNPSLKLFGEERGGRESFREGGREGKREAPEMRTLSSVPFVSGLDGFTSF